ncbi:hypothetical protein [Arthrobacter sp. UYCu712]
MASPDAGEDKDGTFRIGVKALTGGLVGAGFLARAANHEVKTRAGLL